MSWIALAYPIKLDNGRVDVHGIEREGLGIHLSRHYQLDVTHIRTGLRLASFRHLSSALSFSEKILGWYDWEHELTGLTKELQERIVLLAKSLP